MSATIKIVNSSCLHFTVCESENSNSSCGYNVQRTPYTRHTTHTDLFRPKCRCNGFVAIARSMTCQSVSVYLQRNETEKKKCE